MTKVKKNDTVVLRDTLDVSQDQKDALKKYVQLMNIQTTFYTDDNTLVAQIN